MNIRAVRECFYCEQLLITGIYHVEDGANLALCDECYSHAQHTLDMELIGDPPPNPEKVNWRLDGF